MTEGEKTIHEGWAHRNNDDDDDDDVTTRFSEFGINKY